MQLTAASPSFALVLLPLLPLLQGPQDEAITFRERPVAVGDRRADVSTMSMELSIEIALGGTVLETLEQSQEEHDELRTTILAMDGDQITKVELSCDEMVSRQSGPQGDLTDENPLSGETVVVLWDEGRYQVLDEDGAEVEQELHAAAVSQTQDLFTDSRNEFAKLLPDGPMEVGDALVVDEELAREMFGSDNQLDRIELTLTLTGRREHDGADCGVFAVELSMGGEVQAGLEIETELTGEALVGVDTSWPHLLSLSGEIELDGTLPGGEQPIEFRGAGPMTMRRAATYSRVD